MSILPVVDDIFNLFDVRCFHKIPPRINFKIKFLTIPDQLKDFHIVALMHTSPHNHKGGMTFGNPLTIVLNSSRFTFCSKLFAASAMPPSRTMQYPQNILQQPTKEPF
jgi:hypothetical protein